MLQIPPTLLEAPTVAQLIEVLSKQNPNARVMVSLPGHPVEEHHAYAATVTGVKSIKHLKYSTLKDGWFDEDNAVEGPAITLTFLQDRDNMIQHAVGVSDLTPILPPATNPSKK